jgi:hypothetical protein
MSALFPSRKVTGLIGGIGSVGLVAPGQGMVYNENIMEPPPNLVAVFKGLKRLLKPYEKPLVPKFDIEGRYDLWSVKDIVVEGRKKKEVFFAGLIIQSDYVGFYFMPVYADSRLSAFFKPELLRLLKGKSCFHIKALDANLEKAVSAALKKGFALYKKKGWI